MNELSPSNRFCALEDVLENVRVGSLGRYHPNGKFRDDPVDFNVYWRSEDHGPGLKDEVYVGQPAPFDDEVIPEEEWDVASQPQVVRERGWWIAYSGELIEDVVRQALRQTPGATIQELFKAIEYIRKTTPFWNSCARWTPPNEPLNLTRDPGRGCYRLTCFAHQSASVCPPRGARCILSVPLQVSAGVRQTMPKVVDWFGVLGAEHPFEIMLEGDSLGSVLGQLERLLRIKFVPLDAGKHFGVWRDGVPFQYSRGMPHESLLTRLGRFIRRKSPPGPILRDATTDIHVYRGAQSICPGQDLTFPLEPDDEVVIYDMLLC